MPPIEPNSPEWELLLTRYVSGEASPSERAQVDAWAARAHENAAELAAWHRTWRLGDHPRTNRFDVRAAERSLDRRLDAESTSVSHRGTRALWRIASLAAAVFLLAVIRWPWFSAAQQFREFASAPGSRVSITLRDGSRLVLGPASRLRVPADFGATSRSVDLEGEAMLSVVHDARRPFEVHTTRATVRDVGTTFVVRAYADDPTVRVAVDEGEVTCDGVSLHARDAASIEPNGRIVVERRVDVSADFGWTQGSLAFHDTPLRAVAHELERTYDIRVTIADSSLGNVLVTASMAAGESVDDALGEISRAVGARYARAGRSVLISSASAPNRS